LAPGFALHPLVLKLWILVMLGTTLAACGAAGVSRPTPVPAAVSTLIQQLEAQPQANPPLYIASYEYRGQVVYYVPPRCCDIFSDLYSSAGDLLCHPDGGLAGHGDGRCSDFLSQRKNETIIWRDRR
jgi:uncharacterized protein DUF6970